VTTVDTNVFSILWNRHPDAPKAAKALEDARTSGPVTVNAIVYAELLAYPNMTEATLEGFFEATAIEVDEHLSFNAIRLAGTRYAAYASRRRAQHGQPRRILADFLIGAHAFEHKAALLTFDRGRYATDYPELEIIHP
jgi:predicted nucleic acid-binding protein